MKRAGGSHSGLPILSVVGLVGYVNWPKYGVCPEGSRDDEIACVARRNLHFGAHMTWSFNSHKVEVVMAEVGPADIPVVVEMLGDDECMLRGPAGCVLTELGAVGLPALKRAAGSRRPEVRRAARSALLDRDITPAHAAPPKQRCRQAPTTTPRPLFTARSELRSPLRAYAAIVDVPSRRRTLTPGAAPNTV